MTQVLVFKAKNLTIEHDRQPVLTQASFEIAAGSRTAILGVNGTGKSSLLQVLAGAANYQGKISFYNQELKTYSIAQLAQKRAVIEQQPARAFGLRVRDVLASIASWKKHPKSQEFNKIIEDLRISHLLDNEHAAISGGELARVALARALWQLLQAPEGLQNQLLLLDEPTSALDLAMQESVLQQLRNWNEQENLTILTVLHDLNQALFYFPQVLLLHQGQVWAQGQTSTWLTAENIEQIWGQKVCTIDLPAPENRRVFIPIHREI